MKPDFVMWKQKINITNFYCQPYCQCCIITRLVIKHWEYTDEKNWFEPVQLGEYISALSNAAAYHSEENAYFIWGVNDETHEIVGTTFNQYRDYNREPYQNYLARNLSPSIGFEFDELNLDGKRIVVLTIPAAKNVPTAFLESDEIKLVLESTAEEDPVRNWVFFI